MKKFKRIIALMLVLIMSLSLLAACANDSSDTPEPVTDDEEVVVDTDPEDEEEEEEEPASEQGKVLNIWGWNNEFQGLFESYFEDKGLVPEGVEVKFTIVPNDRVRILV